MLNVMLNIEDDVVVMFLEESGAVPIFALDAGPGIGM